MKYLRIKFGDKKERQLLINLENINIIGLDNFEITIHFKGTDKPNVIFFGNNNEAQLVFENMNDLIAASDGKKINN